MAALPSTLGLAFSSLGPEMSEEEWLLNTAPCIWGASLSEKPGACCRAEKLKAILSPSLKCVYFTLFQSAHPPRLWAAAPSLVTRGQRRHGFGMARLLAKFFRPC